MIAIRVFCLLLFLLTPLTAAAYPARVVAISDGDTITVEPVQGGARSRVRLHGVDAPELNQPHGQAARNFVAKVVLYKQIDVRPAPQRSDRYGRIVAVVEIPGVGVLQELLLEAGLAWIYPRYCKDCDAWEAMRARARKERKGLWAGEGQIEPWEWRKGMGTQTR